MKRTILLVPFFWISLFGAPDGFGHGRMITKSCDSVWSVLGSWALKERNAILIASDPQAGIITFRTLDNELIGVSVESAGNTVCSVRVIATGLVGFNAGTLDLLLDGIEEHAKVKPDKGEPSDTTKARELLKPEVKEPAPIAPKAELKEPVREGPKRAVIVDH